MAPPAASPQGRDAKGAGASSFKSKWTARSKAAAALLASAFILVLIFSDGGETPPPSSDGAAAGAEEWTNFEDDAGYDIAVAANGDVVAIGYTNGKGAGKSDLWVLKLDAEGGLLWERTFGGSEEDVGWSTAVMADGSILATGHTRSKGAGGEDLWVLKLDSEGQLLWEKTLGGSANDAGYAVAAAADGGVLLTGVKGGGMRDPGDLWALKLDAAGELLWEKTLKGSGQERGYDIASTANGGSLIVGYTDSKGSGGDLWVIKLDGRGQLLWEKVLGGSRHDFGRGLALTPRGELLVVGATASKDPAGWDLWLLQLDAAGKLLWERTLGAGGADESGGGIAAAADGSVLATGYTASEGAGAWDLWVMKLDRKGALLWERVLGGEKNERGTGVAAMPDGGAAVIGETASEGAGGWDLWVMRLNAAGDTLWEHVLSGAGKMP